MGARSVVANRDGVSAMSAATDSITQATAALDRFMAALNANDAAGVNDAFNFPHVRFASGKVTVFARRGDFTMETFRVRVDDDGWAKSAWDKRDVIHAGAEKVHFDTQFSRYRADGSRIASFQSIYIVTRLDGHWGIQARSSFAP
jgi:hypothetical protein